MDVGSVLLLINVIRETVEVSSEIMDFMSRVEDGEVLTPEEIQKHIDENNDIVEEYENS